MDKEKFKKGINISVIIGLGLALGIAFFFLIYSSAAIGAAVSQIMTILRPFIVGAVIAYILKSTCNAYERGFFKLLSKRKKANEKKDSKRANVIAVILTYITWIALLSLLLWIAIPQIYESIANFINDIPDHYQSLVDLVLDFKANNPDIAPYIDNALATAEKWITEKLPSMIPEIGSNVVLGAVEAFNILKDIAIGLVISVFFLAGRKTFARKTTLFINTLFKENHANAIIGEARFADRMFGGFLEGKIIDSTIIGIIYFIALVLMDIKYAALLALICGITNIIPFFGPFIGAVPSGLIILMSHENPWPKVLYFVIFVCVIQFIDGNIIDPHIVGGNIKLSPFCVIFAVLFFGGLWGFVGLLVGVPTFAVIYDIVKKIIFSRLQKTGKRGILKEYLRESGKLKKRPVPDTGAEDPEASSDAADAEQNAPETNGQTEQSSSEDEADSDSSSDAQT